MPKIRVDGRNFHYWQSGQGPDLVLVHGLGGNLAGWHLTMVPELQQHYRVTTYDLRGHGRSDAPRAGYTTGDMAEDLRGLMDALHVGPARIVGHSWGADIVLHFALLHPARVSQIVLIEAALLAPLADLYRKQDWEGWPYVTRTLEQLIGAPIPEDKLHDLDYLIRLIIEIPIMYGPAKGRMRDEEAVLRVLEVLMPMWNGDDTRGELTVDSLARILHPTLAISEANSVFRGAFETVQDRLPRCTPAVLPGGKLKHFTGLEHPELILEHMKAFLQPEAAPSLLRVSDDIEERIS
jgi:pimeloyl-ACP methyl ester carboxylesterase